jgi:rubrerythrin
MKTLPLAAASRVAGWLDHFYLRRLVATPRGRSFLLSFMTDAEESDEAGVFDHLLARVDDPELRKMVRVHRDDETHHAEMLRACVVRQGVPAEPVPAGLRIVARVDRMLGGFAARFVGDERGVMEAYVLLQVIEERAVRQFPGIVRALRPVDPASADTVARVLRDEERHVRYAKAISRRYAPDEATLERTVRRFREIEERAYAEHGRAFAAVVAQRDLLSVRGPERLFWRALSTAQA